MFTYAQIWWFLRGWSRFAQIRRIILRFNNYFFCLDELKLEFFWFLKFWNRKLRIEHQIEHNQNHNRYPGYVSVQFEWFVLEIIHTKMTTFNYRPTNFQKWFRVGWTLTWTIKTTDTETDSDMSKSFSVTREPGRRGTPRNAAERHGWRSGRRVNATDEPVKQDLILLWIIFEMIDEIFSNCEEP